MPTYTGLDAVRELRRRDLEPDCLIEALEGAYALARRIGALHPPMFAGFSVYADTIANLRHVLMPRKWEKDYRNGQSLVVHPGGRLSITVRAGDQDTGQPMGRPLTRNTTGTTMAAVVRVHQGSFADFDPSFATVVAPQGPEHFVLLHYVHEYPNGAKELRAELSLPVDLDKQGHVNKWVIRIILEPRAIDPATQTIPLTTPEVSPDIRRLAG